MEKEQLIFDIGMHKGEDIQFYLNRNGKIIAVDADPLMLELAKRKFRRYIETERLILINKAVSDINNEELTFNLSSNPEWNSLNPSIAGRSVLDSNSLGIQGKVYSDVQHITVLSITIQDLIEQYGNPYYCKIDIEGFDNKCLQSLKFYDRKPTYISVETECIGENQLITEEEALETLYSLNALGYRKFALIDQATLQSLNLNEKFYKNRTMFYYINRVFNKAKLKVEPFTFRDELSYRFNYTFPYGASGPYGDCLKANWFNFEAAKELLLQHRRDYFEMKDASPYGFWCDWHATSF